MEQQPVAVGIDVAKATLSICLRPREGKETVLLIRNIKVDINKFVATLNDFQGRIVLEATNHYHWLVTLLLTEAGYQVTVVNPLLAHQYTAGNIRKVKTDKADARSLARMAEVADNLPAPFAVSRETLAIRKKISCIALLGDQIQSMQSALKQLKESKAILGIGLTKGEQVLAKTLLLLRRQRTALEREVVAESAGSSELVRQLDTIPGVTPFVACVVANQCKRTSDQTGKSWVGFVGLDISSRESGTWQGRCKLTKRGNNFLRRRLFSAAWGAVMSNGQFKSYYDLLRGQGRPHVESLLIIARKLVRIMFVIATTGEAYDASKMRFAPAVA
jgi:transposase